MTTESMPRTLLAIAMACLGLGQTQAGIIVPITSSSGGDQVVIVESLTAVGQLSVSTAIVTSDPQNPQDIDSIVRNDTSGAVSLTAGSRDVTSAYFAEANARNFPGLGVSTETQVNPKSSIDGASSTATAFASNTRVLLVDFADSALTPADIPTAVADVFLHATFDAFSSSLAEVLAWAQNPANPGVINANSVVTVQFSGFAQLSHILDLSYYFGQVQMLQNGNRLEIFIGGNWIGQSTFGDLQLNLYLDLQQIPAYEIPHPSNPHAVILDGVPRDGGVLSERYAFYIFSESLKSVSTYTASGFSPFGFFQPYLGVDALHSLEFTELLAPNGTTFAENHIAVYDLNALASQVQAVPEPGTFVMALAAGCSLLFRRRTSRTIAERCRRLFR